MIYILSCKEVAIGKMDAGLNKTDVLPEGGRKGDKSDHAGKGDGEILIIFKRRPLYNGGSDYACYFYREA